MSNTPADTTDPRRKGAFSQVLLAYAAAAGAAVASGALLWQAGLTAPLWIALIADVVATLVIFAWSRWHGNSSFYDPYWSVAPPLLCAYWWFAGNNGWDPRSALAALLTLAWGARLTWNWARGWHGLDHVDWRYRDLSEQTGRAWPLVDLLGIHLFPTALVFLGCLSLFEVMQPDTRGLNGWDALALTVGSAALWLETVADNQLRHFRKLGNSGALLTSGVWAWCRHPNYLGEIGFWVALWLFAVAADPSAALAAPLWGPLAMLALFMGISIPMIERRLAASREQFAAHRARTFALLPFSHWLSHWRGA